MLILITNVCTPLRITSAPPPPPQAFRPGTCANRRSDVLLFIAFALHFGLRDFPVEVSTLLCFAEFLVRSFRAPKSVINALASLKSFHLLQGFTTVAFNDTRVAHFRRALPLTMRHAPEPAWALLLALLNRLCQRAHNAGQAGLVVGTFLSVLLFSMARASSLLPSSAGRFDATLLPTLSDVREEGDGWLLLLKWGKTAQARAQQFWVPLLPVGGSPACPVTLLHNLRGSLRGRGCDAPLFFFFRERGTGQRGGQIT